MLKVCLIKTSVSSMTVARNLAGALIDARLAACVHLSAPGLSCYRWQEEVAEEEEVILSIKTTLAGRAAVVDYLAAHHPYELPEIIWQSFESEAGYGRWVEQEVACEAKE